MIYLRPQPELHFGLLGPQETVLPVEPLTIDTLSTSLSSKKSFYPTWSIEIDLTWT